MITQMRMKNFKSWADTGGIRLAPLTGFFGVNSSGKTSLLQMLLLLKQTTESSDRSLVLRTGGEKDGLINLGPVPEIIHKGADLLTLSLVWELTTALKISDTKKVDKLRFTTSIHGANDGIYVENLNYIWTGLEVSMIRRPDTYYDLKVLVDGKSPKRSQFRPAKYLNTIKAYGFSQEAIRYYQDTPYLDDLVFSFEQLFEHVYYLGPLRDYPQRTYTWAGEQPKSVGQKGELAVAALLARGNESVYKKRGPRKFTLK